MNSQEELGGFCFNCATKTPQFSPTIPQTRLKQSSYLRNPWPVLVRSDDPYSVCAHPLTRTLYAPMTMPDMWAILSKQRRANRVKHHPDDLALFDDHFIYLHECAHLVFLDWTPLKEIARVILSLCYDSIVQLMQSCSTSMSDEDAWEMFIENSRKLGLIEKSIKLPEELVATAFAIRAMEDQTLPGEMWTGYQEELEILKERVLAHEEKNFPANPKKKFPGFREYYKRTEPLIQLLSARPHLLACVIPLLQPVIGEEGERVKLYPEFRKIGKKHFSI